MRQKLAKFTRFAHELLPHEIDYLLGVEQFEDEERLHILKDIRKLNAPEVDFDDFDRDIDKRKYSHLKNWIEDRLDDINVDKELELLSRLEQKILTDSIRTGEEKEIQRRTRRYTSSDFYFRKFYRLVRLYADYLLIRIRKREYDHCIRYLETHREEFDRNLETKIKLREASEKVVLEEGQRGDSEGETAAFLSEVFSDDSLDALNRYNALVRLTFLLLNSGQLEKLLEYYDTLDGLFREGKFYSPRLLLNYYNNRLLLHSRRHEYDRAEYYGRLAVRSKNADYLMYLNNLSAILIRNGKAGEAMELMQESMPDMKASASFFNKAGFVNYYARALMEMNEFRRAENYLDTWLRAYRKEILAQRWHMFFSTYLECLLFREKSDKVLRVVRRFKLIERESKIASLPSIKWYHLIALYREGYFRESEMINELRDSSDWGSILREEAHSHHLISLEKLLPQIFQKLKVKP